MELARAIGGRIPFLTQFIENLCGCSAEVTVAPYLTEVVAKTATLGRVDKRDAHLP